MIKLFKKIQSAAHNRTTYRVGLLQAKAYRILKNYTNDALAAEKISTVEWALLGLLHDNVLGMRLKMLADELGVEASFVTTLVAKLKKMELVDLKSDLKDSRVKIVYLSTKGDDFVLRTEKYMREDVKKLLGDIPLGDIVSYISVLEKIIENSAKISRKLKGTNE